MLADLSEHLSDEKRRDLIARLDKRKADQALAAEAELGLIWALSKVGDIEVEPRLNGRVPEALSRSLFPGKSAVIEVTALSDEGMSGEQEMQRAVELLSIEADRNRKKARNHLFFQFLEVSGSEEGRWFRRRCISPEFTVNNEIRDNISNWVKGWSSGAPEPLRITSDEIDVVVSYRERAYAGHNFHCTMPPVAGSLRKNTLHRALRNKEAQLPKKSEDISPCIFLMDAGSSLLRDLRNKDCYSYSGNDIILDFLRSSQIDVVAVFSCKKDWHGLASAFNNLYWTVSIYHQESVRTADLTGLNKLASMLPPPSLEGYSARSRHRDGHFSPQATGRWLGTKWKSEHGVMTELKISAKMLQEVLSGIVSPRELSDEISVNGVNLFARALQAGQVIKNLKIEGSGIDKDDDIVVIELGFDVSSAKFSEIDKQNT